MAFVLVHTYGHCEDGDSWYTVTGVYETLEDAQRAMYDSIIGFARECMDGEFRMPKDGEDFHIGETDAYVLDGPMWLHVYWYSWRIFGPDDFGRVVSV